MEDAKKLTEAINNQIQELTGEVGYTLTPREIDTMQGVDKDNEPRFSYLCSDEKRDGSRSPLSKLQEKRSCSILRQQLCINEEQNISFGKEKIQSVGIDNLSNFFFNRSKKKEPESYRQQLSKEDPPDRDDLMKDSLFKEPPKIFCDSRLAGVSKNQRSSQEHSPLYGGASVHLENGTYRSLKGLKTDFLKVNEAKSTGNRGDVVKITIETNAREDNPILLEIQKIFSNLQQDLSSSNGKIKKSHSKGRTSDFKLESFTDKNIDLPKSDELNCEDMTINDLSSISITDKNVHLDHSGGRFRAIDFQESRKNFDLSTPKQISEDILQESSHDIRQFEYDTFQRKSGRNSIACSNDWNNELEGKPVPVKLNKENIYKELEHLRRLTKRYVETDKAHRESSTQQSRHGEMRTADTDNVLPINLNSTQGNAYFTPVSYTHLTLPTIYSV
eukprot:TRINITY_DN4242_c0_g1_i9.p1 TRINITY_DN4242_c0_g1~~TRINITY_DN4242_c0_g1_i9.p1  ORF type:complete len:445 (-),score=90.74 TRINITY_DN4242_c0_g1_i9:35-1369(-)